MGVLPGVYVGNCVGSIKRKLGGDFDRFIIISALALSFCLLCFVQIADYFEPFQLVTGPHIGTIDPQKIDDGVVLVGDRFDIVTHKFIRKFERREHAHRAPIF